MNKVILLIGLMIILTSLAIYSQSEEEIPEELGCEKDTDCVPATCCHPTSCIDKNNAPDCSGMLCSMECKPGTLDCGQGECVCKNRECIADIFQVF